MQRLVKEALRKAKVQREEAWLMFAGEAQIVERRPSE